MTNRPPMRAVIALAALALAGCASERFDPQPPAPAPVPQYTGSIRPQVQMQGRWQLSSASGAQCAVNIAGAPGAANGTLAPEGGCPGNFYMSRHWSLEPSGLVLRDHTGQVLGQLSSAGAGRFEGRAQSGEPITLSR